MATNQGDMYRLNSIAHVAGFIDEEPTRCIRSVHRQQKMVMHDRILPYIDRANLLHVTRLNDYWFKLDEPLISTFVERWHPESYTFHMPFGEYTITLQNVAYQFGLPIDDHVVSGCLSDFEQLMEGEAWLGVNKFRALPPNASEATVQIYARGYIMMLLSMALFADKFGVRVHLRWLLYVADLDGLGKYNWSSTTLSWWGRFLPMSDEKGPRVIATRHRLDMLSENDFIWMLYNDLEVIQVVHPDILRPEHTLLWKSTIALIYFAVIEWHQVDRILF
ncbi:serine/threonine-protein phosphatase 7 long form homolog [Arachis hypogaea]|uniref:serine/threonine-protein phosphatase 7 long form homolog n=1 Tax=Arachis hypogaea TaxID=3818 RepID=UPI000DEC64FC|nr:serine/threonine-protein phosphatase 7 long form homolog [Arachis hypogaea]